MTRFTRNFMKGKSTCLSADGKPVRRHTCVYVLFTCDGGKTWAVEMKKVAHAKQRGMVCFDEKITAFSGWHFCRAAKEHVGDHRIYVDLEKAEEEVNRRNGK
jgi:hypothetical protein